MRFECCCWFRDSLSKRVFREELVAADEEPGLKQRSGGRLAVYVEVVFCVLCDCAYMFAGPESERCSVGRVWLLTTAQARSSTGGG